jgi:hypothetical protein
MQRHRNPYAQILIAMPAIPPTKTPDAPAAKSPEEKLDRFKPEMPQIPGVSNSSERTGGGFGPFNSQQLMFAGGLLLVVVWIALTIGWLARSKPKAAVNSAPDAEVAAPPAASESIPTPPPPAQQSPGVAATVEELEKPWAAKKFRFVKPLTQETIDAMVMRLPGGGLWAFSLQAPYGRCELEFVTDLAAITAKYGYKASHPMVVNPCDSTVYDPLKVGPLGGDTWARGEIVRGSALRPPISIDVSVRGNSIIANSIE